MISVIIPTHDPRWLAETVASVLAQAYQDFEIVLVPNGPAPVTYPEFSDPRIRIVPYTGPASVGAIKRFGFMAGLGKVLLELDHDDILTPDCLEEVQKAFDETHAGFVYSGFAEFRDDGAFQEPWSASYGWKPEKKELLGKKAVEYAAWDPSPASLGLIDFAPNHVRAWDSRAYRKAGGHDPRFKVCDDHDLLIRTYLSTEMVRIPRCLYLYRIHTDNTYLIRNQEIRGETWKLYGKHIESLVLHWARGKKLPAVDLNLSYEASSGWEKAPDGDYGARWPWEDSSVGTFRAYDFLNSLPDKKHAMSELHRCLAPGGWVFSFTPAAPSKGAFMDPNVRSYWNQNSLWYWTDKNFSRWIKNETVRFQSQRMVEAYPSLWHQQQDIRYVTFDGVAFKPGYDGPGEHKI